MRSGSLRNPNRNGRKRGSKNRSRTPLPCLEYMAKGAHLRRRLVSLVGSEDRTCPSCRGDAE